MMTAIIRNLVVFAILCTSTAHAGALMAGVGKVDISAETGTTIPPLYAKALVLKDEDSTLAMVTLDVVALEGIGPIGADFLPTVRGRLEQELGIVPANVLINASHCHGIVCADVADRTVQAVKAAMASMVPVNAGSVSGGEHGISENRRFFMKDGSEVDSRHAYSMPWDEDVERIGPIDTEIGVLRLDTLEDTTLAVVYNFACHPIIGVPGGYNTSDLVGFASQVIEDNTGDGTVALFLQGCAGDINPVGYKAVDAPRDAEPLGNRLGLSTLKALREIHPVKDSALAVINERLALPRANTTDRIAALEAEQARLVASLQGTSLNLKTFLPLIVKYSLSDDYPSYYSHEYLRQDLMGLNGLDHLDEENRRNLDAYMQNIRTMEALTRIQTNLNLLRMHQKDNIESGSEVVDVEVMGVRIGDFVLITFPGELTTPIGLTIKKQSPHMNTYVAGYTNGYIYYAPTDDQLRNTGCAQEDCDTILAPGWQSLFEEKAAGILERL